MWNRKLGLKADHRKAMLRNMATSMIQHGEIETTECRAKELKSVVEKLITLGKKGDLHARRLAASYVRDIVVDKKTGQTAIQKLFDEIAPYYKDRNGGYTSTVKSRVRRGDASPMAVIKFV